MKMLSFQNRQHQALLISILIAALLFIGASIRHEGFGSLSVFINLLDDNAFLGIAAVGMTFVILSGGIDLSVGAVIGLTSILAAILIERLQWHPALAGATVIGLGALLGMMMGLIIAFFELAPFLVTLAGMFLARGLAFTLSLDSIPLTHSWLSQISQARLPLFGTGAALPMMSLTFLIVVAIAVYLASMTRFGRNVYAIGGSEISARLMGLPVARTQVLIYTLSGATAAVAGVVYSIYTQSGNSTAATGLELDAIAAVVIGGTLLTGGSGYVVGTLVGTLILGMIQTIITFEADLNSWWTRIVIGAFLLVFVLLQRVLAVFGARKTEPVAPDSAPSTSPGYNRELTKLAMISIMSGSLLAAAFAPSISFAATPQTKLAGDFVPHLTSLVEDCPAGQRKGVQIEDGLHQITGTALRHGQRTFDVPELPDPAPPYVTKSGEVEIYGSAKYFIRFRSWNDFANAGCYEIVNLPVRGPGVTLYNAQYTHPWDMRKYRVETRNDGTREVLIGGSMSATRGRPNPIWPEDNINRRIYFFRINFLNEWIRDVLPIVESISNRWLGHSYGGNLIQENSRDPNVIEERAEGQIGFFYEKVSDDRNNTPYATEIFAVRMSDFDSVLPGSEMKIMGVQRPHYPATARPSGGFLIEGPRPLQIEVSGQKFFVVGFSSGDFPTDSYYLNVMWSKNLFGPYTPLLTEDGKDLLDLGFSLKDRYGLSFVGRPSFYRAPDGKHEMLFHAVVKDILPDNDYTKWPTKYQLWEFHRSLFKASVEFVLDKSGNVAVRVLPSTKSVKRHIRARD